MIEVKNICKNYALGEIQVPALREVSLVINPGDFLVITGRNGSGKSTLLRQLGLLDKPDTGEIFLANQPTTKMNELERSRLRLLKLGYIFQEYALIAELSALENVMLPAMMLEKTKICQKRALETLAKVGLEKKARNLPRQLSGGEQQKVAIARALINDPMILFADEPTANLDSVAAKDILNIFKKLNSEKHTVVMITHEPEETKYANRLVKLADGKIV
ncbi:ABC transporter ATP-binding protein [Candidatus Parcubacteria bacterium]|nr:MAG: ABC transporter ATP-binding protein [Candidatus Parcubacteria bacterium]